MTDQWTADQQAWQSELEQNGKVTIRSSFGSMIWRVGLAIVLVAAFVYGRYNSGDIGQRGLTIAIAGFALLILACVAFVVTQYRGKSVVVDRHGVTLMDGASVPWTDITGVGVFAAGKTSPAVAVSLTEPAWNTHLDTQNAAGKLMHKANKIIVRDRTVVLPSYLAANPAELAGWMNRFAQGFPDR